MSSPRFGARGVVVDAVAMAVREAWAFGTNGNRVQVLQTSLRRILGNEPGPRALSAAIELLTLQPQAPDGDVEPPAAQLQLCVRCREVKLTEERKPFRGKTRMEFLRDEQWMTRQFEHLGRSDTDVARELGCSKGSVQGWRHRHGIDPGKSHQPWMHVETMQRLIVDKQLGPGEVAEELGCEVHTVREWARRLGLASQKSGWAHHAGQWWRDRVAAGWTQYRMAAAAGIVTHAVGYHLRKWGLDRAGKGRTRHEVARLRKPKYPKLYEPGWLRAQMGKRGWMRKVAQRVGCAETSVKYAAVKIGLLEKAPPRPSPWTKDPEWYRERFERGLTAEQIAQEVGDVTEKSIINYMGELGLLDEYHQKVERWDEKHLARTRSANTARLLGRRRAELARAG